MEYAGQTAVAIGNFDGVHKGHQKLLQELKTLSDNRNLIPTVYTFRDHPLNLLKGKGTRKLITDKETKKKLFRKMGIDAVIFEKFENVKNLAPEAFVKQILVDELNMKLAVVGENNRFGKHSAGDTKLLCALSQKYGFSVHVVKPLLIDGVLCSSSAVRNAVDSGDVGLAEKLLGRPYRLSGNVVDGKKLGRTFGFPTANMVALDGMLLPKYGVYATTACADGQSYPAITNVGVTSFDKVKIERIETHIIGFDGNLYGKKITIDFLRRIRGFINYRNVTELEKQLQADKEERLKFTEETQ